MAWPEKVAAKLRELPDKPGCYLMRDREGRIIYVGKAISLRRRVQQYFRNSTLRSASPKVRGMVHSVVDLDYIVVRNEAEAILTEGRLIKDYRPRYNVSFRDDKRFILLRIDTRAPFPRLEIVRIRKEDGAQYFGPFANSSAARAALDFTEKRFGLRKCKPDVPGEIDHRHCINDIVRFCSAPCIGKIDPAGYAERVAAACAFLRGESPAELAPLRAAMQQAATEKRYEDAAALRDTLLDLQSVIRQRARAGGGPRLPQADAARGVLDLQHALDLPAPPRVIEAYDISNISGTYTVASMVCAVDGLPRPNRYKRFRIRTVEGSDDPRSMAEAIRRRFTRLREEGRERPDLVLIDGGLTQLGAARAVLAELGFADLPSAGLAKRFEEVYWREGHPPLRLPRDSKALHVLQRLRDEAHRFALTYHRALRSRRLRESILDEVPGVGERRKETLLRHFGSVRRLARATPAAIAALPGIGPELAQAIHTRLHRETDAVATEPGDHPGQSTGRTANGPK